jgi:hypothetical protein
MVSSRVKFWSLRISSAYCMQIVVPTICFFKTFTMKYKILRAMIARMKTRMSFWKTSYVNWVKKSDCESGTNICHLSYQFCVKIVAGEIFIVLGHRAPSPGVCRPVLRDRTVARRLKMRPPHGPQTAVNKPSVTECNISKEWRSHTNFFTRVVILRWYRQKQSWIHICGLYWCGSDEQVGFKLDAKTKFHALCLR